MILVYYLILINLVAFILYGADKAYAKKGARRISERTLLLWAWLGGSIGAFHGMRIFRHKTQKPKFKVVPVLMAAEIVICGICLYQNYHLVKTEYEVDLGLSEDITIVQVSDLHNQVFGLGESVLLDRIAAEDPDIIVVTGDIVDTTHTSYGTALQFIEGAVKIAPVYYVTGNHEVRLAGPSMDKFLIDMVSLGVVILDDKYIDVGEYVLAGIADKSLEDFDAYDAFDDSKPVIMLAHEPQYHELYQSLGADLVLAGHYHGGQIIIPGVGGLMSPEFDILPKPYEGVTDYSGMTLILSRGLGNSVAPVRINNYPELIVIKVT